MLVCVCLLLSVIIFAWNVRYFIRNLLKWTKNEANQVCASHTRKEIRSTMAQQTNKRMNQQTQKNGDLTVKRRNSSTGKCCSVRSQQKWHNLQLFSDGNFSFCDFAFYCDSPAHTRARAIHTPTKTAIHVCSFGGRISICVAQVAYPFSITPPYEVEIESCCWAFSSLRSLAASVWCVFHENETMHVFISV